MIDIELFLQLDEWLDTATQVVATVILVAIQIPLFLAVMVPLSAAFLAIQVTGVRDPAPVNLVR